LRNSKDLSPGFGDRTVHLPGLVFEDPQLDDTPREHARIFRRILFFNPEKHKDAGADARMLLFVDDDPCAGYSLDNCPHTKIELSDEN